MGVLISLNFVSQNHVRSQHSAIETRKYKCGGENDNETDICNCGARYHTRKASRVTSDGARR